MDSAEPRSVFLRSTSAVSLHERFSQVLVDQLTLSRMVTYDPFQLQQRKACDVLRVKKELPSPPSVQTGGSSRRRRRRRRSVWARLGWQKVTRCRSACRPKGFWSFRNKYRWSTRSICRRRTLLSLHLRGGGASTTKWSDSGRDVPTRKQLDAQLDRYMSTSKRRLDQQLDDYMSMSRSRLDAELDEYMSMAGQTHLYWD